MIKIGIWNGLLRFPPHSAPSSGAQSLIGYLVDLSAEDGTACVTLDMQPPHLNRNQTLHGGIHAMMLDAAAGFAASRSLAGSGDVLVPVVTLTLNTSFLAAAEQGMVVTKGWVSGGGRKIIFAEAELRDASGVLCSRGVGVFKRIGS